MTVHDPEPALVAFFPALLATGTPGAEVVARAFAAHLASIDAAQLPPAAQPMWDRIVVRLLKAPASLDRGAKSPIPERAIAAIASWPQARVNELVETVRAIAAEVERAANDRLADETNAQVSRAYL